MKYVIALCVVVGLAVLAGRDEYRAVRAVERGEITLPLDATDQLADNEIDERWFDDKWGWSEERGWWLKSDLELQGWRVVELMQIDTFPDWDETGIVVDTIRYTRWMRFREGGWK